MVEIFSRRNSISILILCFIGTNESNIVVKNTQGDTMKLSYSCK